MLMHHGRSGRQIRFSCFLLSTGRLGGGFALAGRLTTLIPPFKIIIRLMLLVHTGSLPGEVSA
ncbi:hypothetical protein HAALTHF_25760n [Vreelandella aquamarina]|jgi:hypothetical protein|nr:hypothetical protein HAALTHF_25760n [Halomonas axialensis]